MVTSKVTWVVRINDNSAFLIVTKRTFCNPNVTAGTPFGRGLTAFPSFTDHELLATSHAAQFQGLLVTSHSPLATAFLAYHIDLPSTYGLAWRAHRRSAWSPEACQEFAESCLVSPLFLAFFFFRCSLLARLLLNLPRRPNRNSPRAVLA
jgi:hypothetical protein